MSNESDPLTLVQELETLRMIRNQKLAATDYWMLSDHTPTQAQIDYRQALRDITENFTGFDNVVFPVEPEGGSNAE